MNIIDMLVHERTLPGAVDSYLRKLVHVRPQVAGAYATYLEDFVASWMEAGYPNAIEAVTPQWLETYLAAAMDRSAVEVAIRDFYCWAQHESLTSTCPLGE